MSALVALAIAAALLSLAAVGLGLLLRVLDRIEEEFSAEEQAAEHARPLGSVVVLRERRRRR
jgi:hypothetical protein